MTAQEHAVMQQALEALVKSLPRLAPHGEQDWLDSKAAITALLAALEQEPCDIAADGVCEALECCNVRTSALCPEQVRAQPEQEWLTGCPNCGMDGGCDYEALECCKDVPETDCGNMEPVAIVSSVTEPGQYGVKVRWLGGFPQIAMKLYTHPPRREWRGLDKDETMHLMNDTAGNYWADEAHIQRFASAVQSALKEKNHA